MLRAVPRTLSRALQALLLSVAVAATLVWAQSYFIPGRIEFHRWTGWWGHGGGKGSMEGSVNQTWIAVGCGRGRMGVQRNFIQYSAYSWDSVRAQAEAEGPDWKWETRPGLDPWYTMEGSSALAPFRWGFSDRWDPAHDPVYITYLSAVSTRCWVVVALSAAWPLRTAVRHLRHHFQSRHLTRTGLCPQCGYDLRATPTLCPECGSAYPHPDDRSWLKRP
jgi:hypothetical protein